jgi:hypothetical protein
MRTIILIAATAFALGACDRDGAAENRASVDEQLTANDIVANDVTAIDAVTADAANMAADVNYTEVDNATGNDANAQSDAPSRTRRAETPRGPAESDDEPATNVTGNETE